MSCLKSRGDCTLSASLVAGADRNEHRPAVGPRRRYRGSSAAPPLGQAPHDDLGRARRLQISIAVRESVCNEPGRRDIDPARDRRPTDRRRCRNTRGRPPANTLALSDRRLARPIAAKDEHTPCP